MSESFRSRRVQIGVKRHARVDSFDEATPMTHETLPLIASRRWDDNELDPLVPGHVLEAEAAGCDLVVHGCVQS